MKQPEENNVDDETNASTGQKVNVDTLLINEIGQFGKFQFRIMALAMFAAIVGSWGFTEYVFTTARISTRCVIPECDGAEPEWSPYWLSNAVPAAGQSAFDNCQRFGNTTALPRLVDSDTCPSTLFDTNTLQPCEEYVYENTNTVTYDFGLACDEWRRSLIGTIRTFGTLTTLPITGFVSDRWGRRVALTLNAFNSAWLGLARYWSNSYFSFTLLEFLESTLGSGIYSSAYILFTESVGVKYRIVAGALINSSFSIGQITMGLIAWGVPNWRNFTLALYIPQLLMISYFWLINESIRWYMTKGRYDESEALLKKMARVNGNQLSEKSLQDLRRCAEQEAKKREFEAQQKNTEPWLIVQVFRHNRILLRCLIAPIWWITTTLTYYGMSVNSVNLSGNKYLNFSAVAAVGIPGHWLAVLVMAKLGRKPLLIGAFWLCAIFQFIYVYMPKDMYAASLIVYLIAKCFISSVGAAIYVYTAELFPTKYRHSLFGFASMMGRIGSMVAPLTPAIGAQWFDELPFIMFGSLAFISGASVFLMPETLGTSLPDTFEQASQTGLKKDNVNK